MYLVERSKGVPTVIILTVACEMSSGFDVKMIFFLMASSVIEY